MNEARHDTPSAEERGRSAGERPLGDRLLGALGTLLIVAGVGFAVAQMASGGEAFPGEESAAVVPTLRIVEATPGEAPGAPLQVVFETPASLSPGPMGWQAGPLHLHAELDGREVMPGARDITRLGGDRYRWTMRLPREAATLRLFWAGGDHRPLEEGASPLVRVNRR